MSKRFFLNLASVGVLLLTFTVASLSWRSGENAVTKNPNALRHNNKRSLPIHNKLTGMARKAASAEWFMQQRTYPVGYIPVDAEIKAVEDLRQRMIPELRAKGLSLAKSAAGQLSWEPLGPGNIGGRLRGLVTHPSNPNIIYVGSVGGGVWKSTNGGANWTATMSDLITLNISALAMKPGDPNTLYAGTGEAYFTGDCQPGRGILKTTDGGATWKRLHVAQGINSPFITEIAVSPADPNVVYAAGRKAVPSNFNLSAETVPDPGISAIYKSTNSGETWQDMTTGKGIEHNTQTAFDEFATEVIVNPTNANVVYAAFGILVSGGIWKSTNGGQSWTRLTNGMPDPTQPNQGHNRIELAMAPSNPEILYASFSYGRKQGDTSPLKDSAMLGIWKTTNGGQNWTQVATPMSTAKRNLDDNLTTALGGQGYYDNSIIVHPTDPNTIFVAGLDIYKSTDGGNTWAQKTMWTSPNDTQGNPQGLPYAHADHHEFAFDLSTNPPTLYDGSDGGIARSRDLGNSWEVINKDLGVTQFYTFAVHPTNPKILIGGAQDNGTPMSIDGTMNNWFEAASGGDGWQAFFDANNPNTLYTSVYGVNMLRLTYDYNSGQVTAFKEVGLTDGSNGITQDDASGAGFFAPYEMSPNNPSVLVLGTYRLLKSTNRGDSWTAISGNSSGPSIVTLAIAEGNDNMIWFATRNAEIIKTENNGGSYTDVTGANLPKRFITDIELDPSNTSTVYLTYSGYGSPHVFKSTNAGGSWTNITNNLPDTPANAIQVHPQQPNSLFLATDIGVFVSEDGGQTWVPSGTGFPTVQTVALVLDTKQNRIYAATHGRGVYSAPLTGTGGAASLNIDVAQLDITLRPGTTRSVQFNLGNTGTAALSYNITATGPSANGVINARANFENGYNAPMPKFNLAAIAAASGPARRAGETSPPSSPLTLGNYADDVIVYDDGNNTADDYVGLGPNNGNSFYWLNSFTPAGFSFRLEAFDFYMRTEGASSNPVFVGVLDVNGNILAQGNLTLATAPNGSFYNITVIPNLSFNDGQTFAIVIGASNAIPFPAGTDVDAAVPNRSFYLNPNTNQYVNLNTIPGFQNAAFMIRARGTKSGLPNQPPIARGTISKSQATVNETISFDASQSSDPDGQITQYRWEFGDGSSSNQSVTTHAYSQPGTYTVRITVTDNQGATGQAQGQVTVTGQPNQSPIARATLSKTQARVNESISFDASTSSDPDGQITQYLWNFGDGTTSNQRTAAHAYAQAGNFTYTLTVTDNGGATGQTSGQVSITATPSRLTVTPANGIVATNASQIITVNFDAQGLAEGSYQGQLNITSNGGSRNVPVRITVSNAVKVEETRGELPLTLALAQNYPNPFNPETKIQYALPSSGEVYLRVYNLQGELVTTLVAGTKTAGEHVVFWDGRNRLGDRVASGIYIYRLEVVAANGTITGLTKKLTMMK